MPGSVTTAGSVTGGLTGSTVIGPLSIIGTLASAMDFPVILATGDNTIAVPAGATAFVFQPCGGLATVTFRFAGVPSQYGNQISPINPLGPVSFDPLNIPASIIFNVGTASSGTFSVITFI